MSKLKEALQEVHRFFTPRIHEWEKGDLANPRLWTRIYYEGVGVIDSGWRTIDGQNYKDEKKKDENVVVVDVVRAVAVVVVIVVVVVVVSSLRLLSLQLMPLE